MVGERSSGRIGCVQRGSAPEEFPAAFAGAGLCEFLQPPDFAEGGFQVGRVRVVSIAAAVIGYLIYRSAMPVRSINQNSRAISLAARPLFGLCH
jgi:hypothetical protein